jgi:hypothetical protein
MPGDEMHVKRTAGIVLGGGAIAAWLAGAATSNRAVPDPIIPAPAPIDARGSNLAKEIARLHERLRPAAAPHMPGRNLFAFHATAAPAPPTVAAVATAIVEAPIGRAADALPALKLSGIAEDPADGGGTIRTAFISTGNQLLVVKEGEAVGDRYRVMKITSDTVELIDLSDNSTRRLAMK